MISEEILLDNPQRHQSRAGYWFDEDEPIWVLDKNNTVNVGIVRDTLCPDAREGFIRTLAHYAMTMAPSTTHYMARAIRSILQTVGSSSLDVTTLINFRSTLNSRTENLLGSPRSFLIKWHDLGYDGVSEDVVNLLESWTLKGGIRGDAVKRLDPIQGPLTDNELLAFNEGAVRAFEKDQISLSDLALSLLVSNTGRRSIQVTRVKIADLDGSRKNNRGEPVFLISIPRAKQRGGGFRESFKTFAMTQELWVVLNVQRKRCIEAVESILQSQLSEADRLTLPLFPDLPAFEQVKTADLLGPMLRGDYLHLRAAEVTKTLQQVVISAGVRSERTGDLLKIFARRFRYTIGTRASREGLGTMIIAELLDHSDTQSADFYRKNVPEHAKALDEKLSALMAPYARAFQGVIVDDEQDARRGEDPCSRIRFKREATGTCGSYDFCGANVPIPCYTCMFFQAWVDGPHERIHDHLIAERIRILAITGDQAVAAANDRTILAVAQVIAKCKVRREELALKAGA